MCTVARSNKIKCHKNNNGANRKTFVLVSYKVKIDVIQLQILECVLQCWPHPVRNQVCAPKGAKIDQNSHV